VRLEQCDKCGSEVIETRLGRTGHGPLTELRCPKCRVKFYIERAVWNRRKRVRAV
jgi:predicted nucleic-acid-binding Zn-ribbon protein